MCFYSLSDGPCFMAFKLLFLCAVLLTKNRALHQRLSGWACRLSVCLSLCLSVCLSAAAQLPAAACPCLHEPGFCVLLCCGWVFFSCRARGSLFSFQVLERGDLAPRCLFELWVEVCATKTYATCAPSGTKKHVIPWSVFMFLCQISTGNLVCIPVNQSQSVKVAAPAIIAACLDVES